MVSAAPRATVTTAPNANARPQNRCNWNDWKRWNVNSWCFTVLLKRVSCVRIASGAPVSSQVRPGGFLVGTTARGQWMANVVSEWSVARPALMEWVSAVCRWRFQRHAETSPRHRDRYKWLAGTSAG